MAPETKKPFWPARWGDRLLFGAVDLIITFQLTGAFLFLDRTMARAPLWRVGVFLLCAAALAFPLRWLARLLRRWREQGVFLARPGRGWKSSAGWIPAGAVFLLITALSLRVLPALTAAEHAETTVTVTVASGRVGVLSSLDLDGAPYPLEILSAEGDWTLSEDGNWWASMPGSSLTVRIPPCRDGDLFLAFSSDGAADIADGSLPLRRDFSSPDPEGVPRVYSVRGGAVSPLSRGALWLLSLGIGGAYALAARELTAVTAGTGSDRRYRRSLFFALTGIWLLYLAAGNPGAMSPDSLSQLSQALGRESVTDAHPAALTFLWRGILRLTGSPAWITVCQILLYAAVVSAFLGYLARRGLSRGWLTAFALVYGFHVVNGIYAAVLWKDVPYTIVLLWLTLLLVRLGEEGRAFFTPVHTGELGLCLALTLLLRHNGLVVLALAGLVLGIEGLRLRSLRPILALGLGICLVLAVRGPGFRALGVEKRALYDPAEFLHGMAHVQIVTGEEDPLLASLAPAEVWEEIYTPYNANDITMSARAAEYGLPGKTAALGADEVLGAYLRAFARHPFLILRDRLYGCNLLWDPVPTGYNYRVCGDAYDHVVQSNALGFFCRENALTEAVYALYSLTAHHLILDVLVWRPAWCVGLALLLFAMAAEERKRSFLLGAVPMGANALSLAAAMAWQDYRYVYFAFVCGVFLLLSYFIPHREIPGGEEGKEFPDEDPCDHPRL